MRCLVTGATGFLGINLVRELVSAGWDVTAAGHSTAGFEYLHGLPVRTVRIDVTSAPQVDAAVCGHSVVFHAAGDTSFWWRFFERQRRTNVEGTVNVARACAEHGVQRLVYTSTNDVLGYATDGGMVTETTGRFNFTGLGYHYGTTKFQAERRLREFAATAELDVVYLYPGFMLGPFDHRLQLGRLFFDLLHERLPGLIHGGGSYCHVREVARAHVAAATRGRRGAGYLVAGNAGSNVAHRQVWRMMAAAVNATPPRRTLPRWALLLYAYGCVLASEFTRKPPMIDPGQARYMMKHQYCDSSKSQRELGYHVPSLAECIDDAVAWYRQHGYLEQRPDTGRAREPAPVTHAAVGKP